MKYCRKLIRHRKKKRERAWKHQAMQKRKPWSVVVGQYQRKNHPPLFNARKRADKNETRIMETARFLGVLNKNKH